MPDAGCGRRSNGAPCSRLESSGSERLSNGHAFQPSIKTTEHMRPLDPHPAESNNPG